MSDYPIIIHGSENSLDRDAYVLVPAPMEFKAAKSLCDSYKDINANILYIENGQVKWSYKGTRDECNNSILATYGLHEQTHDNPIEQSMERDYALKMMRTVRGLLSYCSRTQYRESVKKSLVSISLDNKIETLRSINLNEIADYEKSSLIETYKFFAFQMGQTRALLEDNVELFTKNSVANHYPQLAPYLKREEYSVESLNTFFHEFVDFLSVHYKKIDKHDLYVTSFHGLSQVINVKKEIVLPPVVVFDIDGTLMNEDHRSHLRETGQWEEYFDLCHLDTPINHIVKLTHDYRARGYEIWLMTGRGISCEDKTIKSMKEHGVEFDNIKMRGKDVFLPDYVLKPAWIGKYIGKERVEVIYDDTDKVIEGFRKKGLNVIDVKTLGVRPKP